ncbi:MULTISPECIES: iron-containing alcohol dehydrogenase [Alteribacter]|uniref:Iron-containing alcohol dehydrogenase n=1 Tax=Alteribacter keqinensis TaxID=2483800 RepID=A0A3M7TNR1_9BACI|nr:MULTISPECIES: iron-containing alcohol dehydrogenase [Alteribacter]MBM7095350.1 iron-containing alcohol dehydrogenase [Alteribacter salitolerans]RNA67092.1 iron-containing alcohol dehydrogenase [Alteribacter keqinensis]
MSLNMKVEHMMNYHTFEIPTTIKHGIGAIEHIGEEVKALGSDKVLLVTDPGIYDAGVVNPVIEHLEKSGVDVVVFNKVEPNPPVRLVSEGSKVYAEEGCNGLVAVGGGSSMDTAKAIGVEATHEGTVLDYEAAEGKKPLENRIPPLTTIPTTAGTGSEVTQWAVITDEDREFKFNTGGPLIAAHLTIIDPKLHVSMPPHVTAMTGVDALAHAIECYTMKFAQPITDSVALTAMEYAATYIRRAYADGEDLEARYGMAQAAMLAGLSYGSESAGAAHAMSQTLGGIIPVAHGQAVAAMMGPVMEFNWKGNPEKFARMAQAFGINTFNMTTEEAARAAVNWMYELVEDLDIPSLEEQGVPADQLERFAKEAMNDPQTVGNPRDLTVRDYEWIYKRCFGQVDKKV